MASRPGYQGVACRSRRRGSIDRGDHPPSGWTVPPAWTPGVGRRWTPAVEGDGFLWRRISGNRTGRFRIRSTRHPMRSDWTRRLPGCLNRSRRLWMRVGGGRCRGIQHEGLAVSIRASLTVGSCLERATRSRTARLQELRRFKIPREQPPMTGARITPHRQTRQRRR